MTIQVCVGSSCHIKGSPEIVELFQKAIKTKTAFGGLCINGVYEYTHPVIINDDLACIIYIGNILCDEENNSKLNKWISREQSLLNTMERNFGLEKCMAVADIIEGHIRILLEKYTYKNSKKTNRSRKLFKFRLFLQL